MAQQPPGRDEASPEGVAAVYARPSPPPNGFAIASLVLGILGLMAIPLVGPILALVFGYKARREIDASEGREGGRGFADAGVVLGWVGLALAIVFAVVAAVVAVAVVAGGGVEIDMPRMEVMLTR